MRFCFPPPRITTLSSLKSAGCRARKTARVLLAASVLQAGATSAVRAQSALDGFDPNANGTIRAITVQPDGKILIGGDFTALSPNGGPAVTRTGIARLNPDGTLDAVFNANAGVNTTVWAILVQADGKILVGGEFSSIGGQTRNNFARLDATMGAADSFDPNATGGVYAIAEQPDGKILAGGFFTSIGGQTRNYIARLDATTAMADAFNPNSNSTVSSIVVQRDGKIVVAGFFSGANSIGGQARNGIARLDPTTGLADSFDPNASVGGVSSIALQADGKILAGGQFDSIGGQTRHKMARLDPTTGLADSFDPNANGGVFVIGVQVDGKILAGGQFSSIGGQARNFVVRLDPISGLADSFNPNANGLILAMAAQPDGKILAGGTFNTFAPNGGATATRNHIARLETDGRLDQTLDINALPFFYAAAVQPDGKIIIGGFFTNILGVPRQHIARLNTDGTVDAAFNPGASDSVETIALQPDGKILVGGQFSSIGGQPRSGIARLDGTTGAVDSFNANAGFASVYSLALQANGKILVGGTFFNIGGQPRSFLARLDPITGLADSFNPNPNAFVGAIVPLPDGKILVGGPFTSIGGQSRNHIARLDGTTGAADSFDPNADNTVSAMMLQSDGKVLVGGQFTSIGGQSRNHFARLDAVTGVIDSFDPNASGAVFSIALQADGKILAAGEFTTIGGQARNYIARLESATGVADSFDPNANGFVYGIAVQAGGKMLVHGNFTSIGGQPRSSHFARLSNDAAALQDLAVTPTGIAWTRAGSSARFARVFFEYSTDNSNYTSLGDGVVTGSNWSLTGLNLPNATNLYVRARGQLPCGQANGSQSILELVRNVFLLTPLQITTAVSRKTHGSAGDFDIPLPLTGSPGVECRSSSGAHTIVFSFSNNVVSGNASVTAPSGGSVSGSPTFSANTMTVNLIGVTDVQQISVTVSSVTDSFAQVLPDTAVSMNILAGDTTGNKTVNASDLAQTKAQSGVPITSANFREDVTPNGMINASDVGLVKSRSGQFLP